MTRIDDAVLRVHHVTDPATTTPQPLPTPRPMTRWERVRADLAANRTALLAMGVCAAVILALGAYALTHPRVLHAPARPPATRAPDEGSSPLPPLPAPTVAPKPGVTVAPKPRPAPRPAPTPTPRPERERPSPAPAPPPAVTPEPSDPPQDGPNTGTGPSDPPDSGAPPGPPPDPCDTEPGCTSGGGPDR